MQCNARFWVYVNNGWVKITLEPGQVLSWARCAATEEGWESEQVEWVHQGWFVQRTWCDQGRDCDGLIEHHGEDMCPLGNLCDGEIDVEFWPEMSGERKPAWSGRARWQRDHAAEAAGY